MPQMSRLGEPSTPHPAATAPTVAVVVPEAVSGRRFWTLLQMADWLRTRETGDVTVVSWQPGPHVGMLRHHATTVIDAGGVNEQLVPRALAAARLGPAARALKSVRLRRRLEPLTACDRLLLGGASTLPLLEWLAPRAARRVVVWLGDDEVDQVDAVLAAADHVLAGGDRTAQALVDRRVDSNRWHRVAEPLVGGPPTRRQATSATGHQVLLVGSTPNVAPALATVLVAAGDQPGATEVLWLHHDERQRDARWADPRFAGLEADLVDRIIGEWMPDPGALATLVLLGPTPPTIENAVPEPGVPANRSRSPGRLAARLALGGTPVIGMDAGESCCVEVDDLAALGDHLTHLLADRSAWMVAGDQSIERARPHRLDLARNAVIDALLLDDP